MKTWILVIVALAVGILIWARVEHRSGSQPLATNSTAVAPSAAKPTGGIDLPADHGKKPVTATVEEKWPDGKLQRTVETLDNGRKSVVYYDHDGKTILLKQEFRTDGTLSYQRHRLLDGSTLAVRWKANGKKQMERTHNPKTGAFTLTHYQVGKSQAVWFKSEMNLNSGDQTWWYFADDGATVKRLINGDTMKVIITDKKEITKYEQEWKNDSGTWKLQSVKDPANNLRYHFSTNAKGVLQQGAVDHLNADGSVNHTVATSKLQPPAAWLGEYDSDDPTFPE